MAAPRQVLRGKGDYQSILQSIKSLGQKLIPDGAFGRAGGIIGSTYGGAPGGALGAAMGTKLAKIVGFGDYSITRNSIAKGTTVPQFVANGGGLRIAHREYIGDIRGSVGFTIQSKMPINPGLASSFPWLSAVAQNFESYVLEGLVFEYRPTSGMIGGATAALGSVIMATDYNVHNPDFPTKQSMESYEYATQCVPYQSVMHGVECLSKTNPFNTFYIRTSDDFRGEQQMYDVGNFFIATQGMQDNTIVGELWVTYDVSFLKPRITSRPDIPFILFDRENCSAATVLGSGTSTLFSQSWAPSPSYPSGPVTISGDVITFLSPGSFLVTINWFASTAPITNRLVWTLDGDEVDSIHFQSRNTFGDDGIGGGNAHGASLTCAVTCAAGDTINVHGVNSLTGLTAALCTVYITPAPFQF